MPRAIPQPIRGEIVRLRQQGQSLAATAEGLGLKVRTVRALWRRYRQQGPAGLTIGYGQCARPGPRFAEELHRAALALKREHPRWGAGLIRVQWPEQLPEQAPPGERTLQRWFRHAGLQPARRRQPPARRGRGRNPHEAWEIDAKEQIALQGGSGASVLSVVDEASGAALEAPVSPRRYWAQVEPRVVQAQLRGVFGRWGLPGRIRVDNGVPCGSPADLPPALALWWIGLGIEVTWNRPRRAQENGQVERFHGLLEQWAEPARCADLAALRERVGWAVRLQREVYPAVDGRSRRTASPGLQAGSRH